MKPTQDIINFPKSNTSITPDATPISSLDHSMKHLKKIKKSLKTGERDNSPYLSTKNITLKRSKEPSKFVKNTMQPSPKKDLPANHKIYTITSGNSNEKSIKIQKMLPKLSHRSKSNMNTNNVNAVLNTQLKKLKYINLNEDLLANTQVLSEDSQYKSKTWLENIITIKDRDKEKRDLTENLKFFTSLIRDIIHRLKSSGKDNESILLERIWRFNIELIDEHIDTIEKGIVKVEEFTQSTLKVQNEMEKIKLDCETKVFKLEKEIQRVKLDYILAKDPRVSNENQRILKLKPLIENVQLHLNTLSDLCSHSANTKNPKKRRAQPEAELDSSVHQEGKPDCELNNKLLN